METAELEVESREAARRLHGALAGLREAVARDADALAAGWNARFSRSAFLPSARNLAAYLAVRRFDLRPFQPELTALGLSTLGRCEAHVEPSLDALLASLTTLSGARDARWPLAAEFSRGAERLAERKEALFGPDPQGPATRIMVTLPSEAADDPSLARDLMAAGADVMRINCAHDEEAAWAAMIGHVRDAAAGLGRTSRVLMDLAGPKIRIVELAGPEKPRLFRGDRFALRASLQGWTGLEPAATLSHPRLLERLAPGALVWIDDGKIGARVVEVGSGGALLEVTDARAKGANSKPRRASTCPASTSICRRSRRRTAPTSVSWRATPTSPDSPSSRRRRTCAI